MFRLPSRVSTVAVVLLTGAFLVSCGSSAPSHRVAEHHVSSTTTTTTSATSTTTTPPPPSSTTSSTMAQVAVPNVIGMKIAPARFYVTTAGFRVWPLNPACNKGNIPSQSVVVSLAVPGSARLKTNSVPMAPGQLRPKGSYVGINWSGCYPNGAIAPAVTGQTYPAAVMAIRAAGLTWTCKPTRPATTSTSTTRGPQTSEPPQGIAPMKMTTLHAATIVNGHSLNALSPPVVQSQYPAPGATMTAGSALIFTMDRCP